MGNDGLVCALFVNPRLLLLSRTLRFPHLLKGYKSLERVIQATVFTVFRQECSQFPQCSLLKAEKIFL